MWPCRSKRKEKEMAQDFGDDMGDFLFQTIRRWISNRIRDALNDRRYERRMERRLAEERNAAHADNQQAASTNVADVPAQAQPESAPDMVYLPFGTEQDAAYFTSVCRENGIQMDALSDADGNGFVRFDAADTDRLAACCREFAELVGRLKEQEIASRIDRTDALSQREVEKLREIKDLPDLPRHEPPAAQPGLGAVTREAKDASATVENITKGIADRVREAREACHTFDDFKERLAGRGIGITTTKDGENMFYKARRDGNGRLLPFGRDDAGNRDWAVGAGTLRDHYGVDATHDWFEENTPRDPTASDGSLDMDGRTPDINQGIDSHDGMDTDTRTLRMEREQNGTDVAPSKVREEQAQARGNNGKGYSLRSQEEDCRASSKQLEKESGVTEREIDISDKMNPVR